VTLSEKATPSKKPLSHHGLPHHLLNSNPYIILKFSSKYDHILRVCLYHQMD